MCLVKKVSSSFINVQILSSAKTIHRHSRDILILGSKGESNNYGLKGIRGPPGMYFIVYATSCILFCQTIILEIVF